jgi:ABC-type branched-subunit amino acid transport system ATPase component
MMPLLQVRGIVAGYTRELDILKGVSLDVQAGQVVSIIGPNGAGKSTVFKTIFGVLRATEGQILFKGREITNTQPRALLISGLCFVPQGRNVFPLMTVGENIELGAYVVKDKRELKRRLDMIYQLFPILKERKDQKAGSLSGGEMQMLEMGRALLLKPELILLDEPSLGLSPLMAREVFDKIREVNREGTAILMVEQNADQSLRMSDYAYVLEEGRNKCDGPAEEIRTNEDIKKLYLGG